VVKIGDEKIEHATVAKVLELIEAQLQIAQ
jgi:hypothetical protein